MRYSGTASPPSSPCWTAVPPDSTPSSSCAAWRRTSAVQRSLATGQTCGAAPLLLLPLLLQGRAPASAQRLCHRCSSL